MSIQSQRLGSTDALTLKGAVCPFCGVEFKAGEFIVRCPIDWTPHHVACWQANQDHCTTLGCRGKGRVASAVFLPTQPQHDHKAYASRAAPVNRPTPHPVTLPSVKTGRRIRPIKASTKYRPVAPDTAAIVWYISFTLWMLIPIVGGAIWYVSASQWHDRAVLRAAEPPIGEQLSILLPLLAVLWGGGTFGCLSLVVYGFAPDDKWYQKVALLLFGGLFFGIGPTAVGMIVGVILKSVFRW